MTVFEDGRSNLDAVAHTPLDRVFPSVDERGDLFNDNARYGEQIHMTERQSFRLLEKARQALLGCLGGLNRRVGTASQTQL